MTPFKDVYNRDFFAKFLPVLNHSLATLAHPKFDLEDVTAQLFNDDFSGYELKQRMRHTAKIMHTVMPDDFSLAAEVLADLVPRLINAGFKHDMLVFIFLPEYIEAYGINHYNTAINALARLTQFVTCEFAVRPFLVRYPKQMLAQMQAWTQHSSPAVRRLASEGSRPRLPWAMALPAFKADPTPLLPILDALKSDPSASVRRSVANNLNDIAKDHPDFVISWAEKWHNTSPLTDKLIKHACRTLLKNAHPAALLLFGYDSTGLGVHDFHVLTPQLRIGDKLRFAFNINNSHNTPRLVRIEYALYFQKKNGQLSRKVFKISERTVPAESIHPITRAHNFTPITTRVYYTGAHAIAPIINGKEYEKQTFALTTQL